MKTLHLSLNAKNLFENSRTHPTLSHTIEELPLVGSEQGGTHEDEASSAVIERPVER